MTPFFTSLPNSFSTCYCSAEGALRAFLNVGCVSPLMIKWTSRPFIPLSEQFTRLANTVENENPVQHGILCCKQGTSPQELSGIVRLAGTKWKAYHSTLFADIVALESAHAVCVVKGTKKGLEAVVDIDNELLKEKFVGCTFNGPSVMIAKSGGVTQQLQGKIGTPLLIFIALPMG